jgi:hypothetical protein
MNRTCRGNWLRIGLMVALLPAVGCVERTAKIQTNPPGAIVIVNDEEVGVSPVKFNFLWYGDYDLILRKPGYQTLKTHYRLDAPWYEVPPFDLVAETLVPATLRDEHVLPTYALEPTEKPDVAQIVERAVDLRDRALFTGQAQEPAPAPAPTDR